MVKLYILSGRIHSALTSRLAVVDPVSRGIRDDELEDNIKPMRWQ